MSSALSIFLELRDLFPQQTVHYLKRVAAFYKNDRQSLGTFVQGWAESQQFPPYPDQVDEQLEDFLRVQWETLKEVLPDAEETYLQGIFDTYAGTSGMEAAVTEAVVTQNYPKKEIFDVNNYCDLVPDPAGSYAHQNYIMTDLLMQQAVDYLAKIFGENLKTEIKSIVNQQRSLYLSYKKLCERFGSAAQLGSIVKTVQPRTFETPDYDQAFEKLFIENEGIVRSFLQKKNAREDLDYKNEKNHKLCEICCTQTIEGRMLTICSAGHKMCKNCIKTYTVQLFNDGISFFQCTFTKCELLLSNDVIRSVWDTSMYSKLLCQRIAQSRKHKRFSVSCPFCNFVNKDQKGSEITCAQCSKKFCISCKKISHLPLACNRREENMCKEVEESMTNALIRKCPRCSRAFIKERGCCNRITCENCRIFICYVCRKVIYGDNYNHFYGQGSQPSEFPGRCPLFSDINVLHANSVIETGKKTLQKMKAENPNVQLPYDPLAILPKSEVSDKVPNQY